MKKILAISLAVMLVLSLAACNTDNLVEYKKALDKTEQITKGQFSTDMSMIMDYNTEGLTSEEIKELNYFKEMKGTFNGVFDDNLGKAIFRNYMNFGGLGFDFDMYIDGEEMVMKLPVVGKYIKMNELADNANEETFNQSIISGETTKLIAEKWIGLMKNDDVFKGKDIILSTPDGEVKTTEYTITLSEEQIRTLFRESLEIAEKDEILKKFYEENVVIEIRDDKVTFEEAIKFYKDNIDNYSVENFKYTALVDIDGYIVSENIIFKINSNKEDLVLRSMDYNIDIKSWDINKNQTFNFPVLTEDNTVDIEKTDEMPDIMKDLFETKN